MKRLRHIKSGRHTVALHEASTNDGPTLLWLHALGGSARDAKDAVAHWPGRVLALDFAAHGESPRPPGGAYTAENFVGDADAALAEAGDAHVAGQGLGAYVALMLAGARPERVPAALLLPGRGLDGGGAEPNWLRTPAEFDAHLAEIVANNDRTDSLPLDPMLHTVETDVRPPDYAREFADAARRLLFAGSDDARPPWWEAARGAACSEPAPAELAAALEQLRG